MSNSKTLQVFSSGHEAEILRTRLDAAGILSIVDGAEVASMFSNIGMALAKVQLKVAPEDYDRAVGILAEDERLRGELTAWSCVRCDEHNDASFELCWNCSKQRDDLDPQALHHDAESTLGPMTTVADENGQRFSSSGNPYAPTWVESRRPQSLNSNWKFATDDDAIEKRRLIRVFFLVLILAIGMLILFLLKMQ
ncbi:MAG: hypothetical protein WBD20_17480 [Pirellulaceae bacterium]